MRIYIYSEKSILVGAPSSLQFCLIEESYNDYFCSGGGHSSVVVEDSIFIKDAILNFLQMPPLNVEQSLILLKYTSSFTSFFTGLSCIMR